MKTCEIFMMNTMTNDNLQEAIVLNVKQTLAEDIGTGDITAQLIKPSSLTSAKVISREHAVICGRPWVDEVFRQVDPEINVQWAINEGDEVSPNQTLFTAEGSARSLLTAERSALNFLQLLSGVATRCRYFSDMVKHTDVKLLDTRKTLPCLRLAQKYAVTQGGCYNHRIGLYDAFLIKENHISACGGITEATRSAKEQGPGKVVEIEVESLEELKKALNAGADVVMLDNFSHEEMRTGVELTKGKAKLEASGNINEDTLHSVAETGVDFISMGTLTKDVQSIDLSMRFIS